MFNIRPPGPLRYGTEHDIIANFFRAIIGRIVSGKETQKYQLSRAVCVFILLCNIVIGNYKEEMT